VHIWLYEQCLRQFQEKYIHRDQLIPKRELSDSLEVLAGLYPAREATPEENWIVVGRKVLSNVMAYRASFFECICLEEFEFFNFTEQVLVKMSAWEICYHKLAQVNYYGY
jgi:hypothetical protein